MKYFTKEWTKKTSGNMGSRSETIALYNSYYKKIKPFLTMGIKSKDFNMHDCWLLNHYMSKNNYVMEFDFSASSCSTNKIIFLNAEILEFEDLMGKISWAQNEVYLVDKKYEFHILFDDIINDCINLRQIIIRAEDIKCIKGYDERVIQEQKLQEQLKNAVDQQEIGKIYELHLSIMRRENFEFKNGGYRFKE